MTGNEGFKYQASVIHTLFVRDVCLIQIETRHLQSRDSFLPCIQRRLRSCKTRRKSLLLHNDKYIFIPLILMFIQSDYLIPVELQILMTIHYPTSDFPEKLSSGLIEISFDFFCKFLSYV